MFRSRPGELRTGTPSSAPAQEGPRAPGTREVFALVAVLALVAVVGAARFGNAFVWDDVPMFVTGDGIYDPASLRIVFVRDSMFVVDHGAFAARSDLDTYRPVTMASFILDGMWGGRRPLPFHVTGQLLHLLAVGLLYALGRRVLSGTARELAWAPALWFGLHPLLVEAHVWINGRSDTLAGVFSLATALVWLGPRGGDGTTPLPWWRAWLAAVLALAGALSKEVAVLVLLPLVLWRLDAFSLDGASIRRRLRSTIRDTIPLACAVAVYVAMRIHALRGPRISGGGDHLRGAAVRVAYMLLDGLLHSMVPAGTAVRFLQEEYARIPSAWFWGAWMVVAALVALTLRVRREVPLLPVGVAWFAIALAPATLISMLAWYGFDRYLYVPLTVLSLGACAGAGALVDAGRVGPRARRVLGLAFAAYVACLGLLSVRATLDWRSSETWYAAMMRDYPEESHGAGGWGKVLVERGAYAEAIPLLEDAVSKALPENSRPLTNLAQALLRSGNLARARSLGRLGMRRFPDEAKFCHIVAVTSAGEDVDAAADALVQALDRDPGYRPSAALIREILQRHPAHARFAERLRALVADPAHARAAAVVRPLLDAPAPPPSPPPAR